MQSLVNLPFDEPLRRLQNAFPETLANEDAARRPDQLPRRGRSSKGEFFPGRTWLRNFGDLRARKTCDESCARRSVRLFPVRKIRNRNLSQFLPIKQGRN